MMASEDESSEQNAKGNRHPPGGTGIWWYFPLVQYPGPLLRWLAGQFAARAARIESPKRERMQQAARILLTLGEALNRSDGETIDELDRATAGTIRTLRREGERVAWLTNLDADRDAELIAHVERLLSWFRGGTQTRAEFIDNLAVKLAGDGFGPGGVFDADHQSVLDRLSAEFPEIDDTQSASTIVRRALRAAGVPAEHLKNFGAGQARRAERSNKSTKR